VVSDLNLLKMFNIEISTFLVELLHTQVVTFHFFFFSFSKWGMQEIIMKISKIK
jgi:hypothetical protein